jgi:hypothetical protein
MEEIKYVVFFTYFTDIGDDKAYYKEGYVDKYGFGCNKKEATLFTESEAKTFIKNKDAKWGYEAAS